MPDLSLPQSRIDQIVEEGLALYRANEARIVAERQNGLRCTCCNHSMPEPTPSGECASCQALVA